MPTQTKKNTFYLTTPIYYVNARPHLGHAYTTVAADVIARYQRMRGLDVRFLTKTDEHGQKIERSAAKAEKTPQAFADAVSDEFRTLWDRMGLSYDDYLRTTEARHKRGVQRLFMELQQRGFIYKGTYTGQYCVSDELYVDAPPGAVCPDCGRVTETVSEENYYFKLSAFERPLLEYYEAHPEFILPETRRNEVMAFVRGGLRDLSISRTSFQWGIPVPGDEKHVIYVWMDALANYITALGYGSDAPEDQARFAKYWPADLHLIGKEISRFHCVYWPAFLMAAGLPLPKSIVAHGWLLFEQSKMSKSRGNIVRAETVLDVLGADALRYFLLREIAFGQDGSFSFDALVQRYNADLANGYGNLVSRTLAMIQRYFDGVVPGPTAAAVKEFGVISEIRKSLDDLDFSRALEGIWQIVAGVDGYLTASAPWKEEQQHIRTNVLYSAAESIRIITALVYPVMPDAAAKVWKQLGLGEITQADLKDLQWGGLKPGTKLGELGPIFPRAEKDAIQRMQEMEEKRIAETAAAAEAPEAKIVRPEAAASSRPKGPTPMAAAQAWTTAALGTTQAPKTAIGTMPAVSAQTATSPTTVSAPEAAREAVSLDTTAAPVSAPAPAATENAKISIDDFARVELRVAQIKVAERVPKADRLLRLEVDLGYEQRQIVAGIAEAYTPESLVGRKVVIVANLVPRKLRGLESNGMIVAASLGEHGRPVLAGFLEDVEIGARLK
jgi:methionyl-tRNA synthetase